MTSEVKKHVVVTFMVVGLETLALTISSFSASAEESLPPIDVVAQKTMPSPSDVLIEATERFDRARADLSPRSGANAYDLSHQAIERLPQGDNAPFDRIVLQMPGVTQDSMSGGGFHVRNEHANVQYRINGILLPDGVSGFGQILDPAFIGNLALIDGVLPSRYGLHTAGILDITTRSGLFDNGGDVSLYGGSYDSIMPRLSYGGTSGKTQYFAVGRFLSTSRGMDSLTIGHEAFHNESQQGRFFGYASSMIDDATRVSVITGLSINRYQIPNNPGQTPQYTAFGISDFNSLNLNENQVERNFYNVLSWQRSVGDINAELAFFSRYSNIHYSPDQIGDLLFNGVASNVFRDSLMNGVQGDAAWHAGPHTFRFGFQISGEYTRSINSNLLLPVDADGNAIDAPFTVGEAVQKTGFLGSGYVEDEWRLSDQLTLNAGLRFDQMNQYVSANQLSPRISLVYKPWAGSMFHIGYARYFTPPSQSLSAPVNTAAYANTTAAPEIDTQSPVRPERSHYFDAGFTQQLTPELSTGVDVYYKNARNLLDDGQFGQAYVMDTFNYARAYNTGVEFKANYQTENLRAYANFAWARQRATQIISNQYLFDADELAYINSHYVYTDHAQKITASAGASYLFEGTLFSLDLIYGSGLRSGFANTDSLSPYAQVNLGVSHEFNLAENGQARQPLTVRFDIINLFDHGYVLRDGSGIGVFAPQYGQRRSFYAGLSYKF
ncbi:TonB-dependent receptor [Beijerinckia mobilis]|uniref:TonB-dependent receptor n=1 Tax=Beijerinckia mobilis TaxID=231434 RepID=UPI000A9604CE|nr:TonB-dependent receptor [Beijerinckia mobilis]